LRHFNLAHSQEEIGVGLKNSGPRDRYLTTTILHVVPLLLVVRCAR
jgi:hypothetical protein